METWGTRFIPEFVGKPIVGLWNDVYSAMFSVSNGVKQGGVASPIMFCLYIDELLLKLADSGVGCWFSKFYVGVLAYADDILLLAPSASCMLYINVILLRPFCITI